jgi:photosystem II stability/assembly factor-like uncharacterized protein
MPLNHRVYVGTIGEGVFRSLDGGQNFARAMDGMFVESHVRALAVHPQNPRTLFLGSEQGLYRSDDGADNWRRVESPLDGKQIWSILIHPAYPKIIVVGTCPAGLFRSVNGGQSWSKGHAPMRQDCPRIIHTRVTCVKADPCAKGTAFWAGVEIDGILCSENAGLTWEPIGHGLSSQDIHDILFVPKDGTTTILAATNNDLNRSTDSGSTWQPLVIKNQLPGSYCRTLAQPIGQPQTVLLGNGNGPPGSEGVVGISKDGGRSWRAASMSVPPNSTIWNFAMHAADTRMIYASSVSGQLYRSLDQGETWEKCAREFGEIRALAWTP